MARTSARTRTRESLPDPLAVAPQFSGAQLTRLLAAGPGAHAPAVSPPASIIPSPGTPPGPVNLTQVIQFGQTTYTVASGTYFYADQLSIVVNGYSGGYGGETLINRGSIWNDRATPGPTLGNGGIGAAGADTVENYGVMVAIADVYAGYDPYNRQHVLALTGNNILNQGQIFALATNGNAIGTRAREPQYLNTNIVTNSGLIAARAPEGNAVGVYLEGRLVNQASGQILAEGANAVAVNFKSVLVPYVPDPVNGGYMSVDLINNAGLIQARSTEPGIGSAAIYLAHTGDMPDFRYTAIVVNSGIIRADYAILTDNFALSTTVQQSIEVIRNLAGGLIEGDILLDRGQDTIENSGTIRGFVSMGEGKDLFDTRNGTFEGTADLFWGDDTFLGSASTDKVTGDNGNDRIEGNGGDDLLLGGGNNDVLIGGAGNDGLFGEYGDDRIVTQGGDFVWGGAGNDRVELGDYTFELVDGNEGFDTLVLPGGARIFDLSLALAEQAIFGFEAIVLGGNKEFVVRAADVDTLVGEDAALRISGVASDRIDLVGAWTEGATETIGGVTYRHFDLDGRTVLVDGPATVAIAASGPASAVGLDAYAGGTPALVPGDESGVGFTPTEFYLPGYRVVESIICNAEELWWDDWGLEPVLYLYDLGCDVTNYGTIAKINETDYPFADAIEGLSFGKLTNYGTVSTTSTWDGPLETPEDGIYQAVAVHHVETVVNNGLISGDVLHGRVYGAIFQTFLTNNGEIYARSEHGYAVGVLEPGIFINHGSVIAIGGLGATGAFSRWDFNNEGRIEAHMVTPGIGESIGIKIYLAPNTMPATITNSGTVIADIAIGEPVEQNYSGYGAVNLTNTGLLDGRVELSLVNDRVTNTGTITGAVRLFDGDDVFDGVGGTQSEIDGGSGNDILTSSAGDEVLTGGQGADILDGKGGADRFVYLTASDSTAAAMDRIRSFQTGVDIIDLRLVDPGSISWTQQTDSSDNSTYNLVTVTSPGGTMQIRVDGALAMSDFLVERDLVVTGTPGNDTLQGGNGHDILDGLAGADLMIGKRGNDTYYVDDAGDTIQEAANEGSDTVLVSASYALNAGAEVETLSATQQAGTGALDLTGNAFAQTIQGNAGANVLSGGGGNDVLRGLGGNDLYLIDNIGVQVIEAAGGGADIVRTSISYTLAAGQSVELLTTTDDAGTAQINLTGNELSQEIRGNAANNLLIGSGGINIFGGGGDVFVGGGGADFMYGGGGADRFVYLAISDQGDIWGPDEIHNFQSGIDKIDLTAIFPAAGDITWHDQVDLRDGTHYNRVVVSIPAASTQMVLWVYGNLALSDFIIEPGRNLFGTAADGDVLTGAGGDDVLNGLAGADQMYGLGGNDTYIVDNAGDLASEAQNQGNDLVYATVSYQLTEGSSIETLSTLDWSQTTPLGLTGNSFANTLFGNAGANFLNGGGGADEMTGFGGDDLYVVDTAGDLVNEAQNAGNDIIYALASYQLALGSSVETLSAIDWSTTASFNFTGNELGNLIFGTAGANVLNGAAGADEMTGFGGDDTYIVDNPGDKINEAQNAGNDIVYALISYTLSTGASVEALTAIDWTQTTALNLTGNELDNPIYGNAGANTLNGAGGADEMTGFGGNDTYVVDNAGDKINEAIGAGSDAVYALVDYTLSSGASVEMLSAIDWTQTTPLNLTGNELDNPIYGNAGANLLNGAGGADTLTGFGGDDLYVVDNAGDAIVEVAGQGNDTVYALVNYTLTAGAAVETLTSIDQAGTGALNLTGNELANSIYANAGINVIDGKGGNDVLKGFGGADTFAFTTALGAGNVDTISDFTTASDKVALDDAIFTAIGPTGALNANAFFAGTAAHDTDDRIIYDSATGQLFYDADGNGAGAAVLFATLNGAPSLTASDFMVI